MYDAENIIPLILTASARGYPQILRELIKYGADVNAQCKAGLTALEGATCYHRSSCANILRLELALRRDLEIPAADI